MQPSDQMQIFAANLTQALEARGWTIQQLANVTGKNRSHLSEIIHCHTSPTITTAAMLCEALGEDFSAMVRADYKPSKKRTTTAA